MRVAIVGSRDYPDMTSVAAYVRTLPRGTVVVSGGARGVDRVAAKVARKCSLEVVEHLANWKPQGPDGPLDRAAGHKRNAIVVGDCDRVTAFWDGKSPGTEGTIKLARRLGKPVTVIEAAPKP